MGFTAYIVIGCIFGIILAASAFVNKKKALGITILCLLAAVLCVLGYMWFTSPM
ncbi:MAG: hypothetical protein IJF87_01440 [Erysipelotrichaceae bacterium]|nr:hypothetical protein [Erysipelotrichaceae bacterium]